jgi:hypothetical protein
MAETSDFVRALHAKRTLLEETELRVKSLREEIAIIEKALIFLGLKTSSGRQSTSNINHHEGMPLRKVVAKAVKDRGPGNFTAADIIEDISGYPIALLGFDLEKNKSNVSTYLRDMTKDGKVEIIEGGAGRRAAIYRKP